MRKKYSLLRKSLRLVWESAPGWATANTVISAIRSFLPLLLLLLLKRVIDEITAAASANQPLSAIISPVAALALVWFLDEALADAGSYIRKKQLLNFEDHMFGLLHRQASRLDLIHFENPEYLNCLSRASREATWRPDNILNNLISLSRSLLTLILVTGLILSFNLIAATVLLAANIPAIWLRLHYAGILYDLNRKKTPEARKAAYFNWLLTGERPSREIRLFGLGDYFRQQFRKSFLEQKEEELVILKKRALTGLLSDILKAAAILGVILIISSHAINGDITLGGMAMILLAFRQGMICIKDLFTSVSGLYEDSLFIADTFEFLELKNNKAHPEPLNKPVPLKEKITVENICFKYPGNETKTLDNVSFTLNKGEVVAIVGHNGAGKSTLVRLLTRLYDPVSGSISYDGTEITKLDPEEYRKMFSVVFQDYMLYNLPAGENIRLGNVNDGSRRERIEDAARAAGIHSLIESLPEGYATQIGNLFGHSRGLSWGEWQKIALARALYRDSPVLILDEPSGALDAETEYEIFNRFREMVRGRTAILISHRFTNVNLADRILVMQNGKIAESGSHRALMEKQGLYYSMYTKQSSRFGR